FNKWGWIFECLLFLIFDIFKTKGFLGFGYGVIGYTQWKYTPLIQISSFTGVSGVSALVIFASGVIYFFFVNLESFKKKNIIKAPFVSLTLFCVVLFFSIIFSNSCYSLEKNTKSIKICAVQHNENPSLEGFDAYASNVQRLIKLSDSALKIDSDISLVVWPETAVTPSIMYQYSFGTDERRVKLVNDILEFIDSKETGFVIGNFHREKDIVQNNFMDYNAALYFLPKKNVLPPNPQKYYKVHLVPVSEYFPFENNIPLGGKNLWTPGNEYNVFEKDGFYFSTPICFEDTFGDTGRKMFLSGARCFINLTNDAWSHSIACQNQHLAMAVFRSVENRIPTVRSSASGQTCKINEKGVVENLAEPFEETFIIAEIPVYSVNKEPTFYTLYGDWLGNVYVVLSVIMLIIGIIKGIIKICQSR
ncbi:MAG: apolipoprotein N-acyltransferase, partial [Treponema sp.]|nr:apolipoprotein N-acyltransferase [Treponema sp.]